MPKKPTEQDAYPIIKISAYRAWKDKPGCKPYDTDFYTEMARIRDGFYKDIVERYRTITDDAQRLRYKVSDLPSLTISAVCKNWRKIENVVSHTGLLNLDIDSKSNPHVTDWAALRDQIFNMQGVIACFLSVSGTGVTFVVKIDPLQHKDCFFSIVDGMKQHMGINVDPGLHDVTRLRFVSDDAGAKIRFNFDEIPTSAPTDHYLQHKQFFGATETVLEPIGEADSEYNFNEAVKRAEQSYRFVEGQKWSFLVSVGGSCNMMGMGLKYLQDRVIQRFRKETNISTDRLLKPLNEVYKLYRSQHGTFNIEQAFERLNSKLKMHLIFQWLHEGVRPDRDELLEICKQFDANQERVEFVIERVFSEYADEFGYKSFPKVQKVQLWLQKRWVFKFNKITCQGEMAEIGTDQFENVNADEIYRQLCMARFSFNLTDIKSLLKSEFLRPYDEILDYFKALPYDPSEDYIEKLASHIQVKDQQFWLKQFKKALVRSIACGLGFKENRIVMVLYGKKEETGKSTFIRFLSPWQKGKYYTESPIIGGNGKDTEIRFSENFIYNMEELAGLSRVDVNKLKADISKAEIKERRSYAAYETSARRRCNFWASTNQKEFLHDDGNTRWLIFEVVNIDWTYKQSIDINKVWAEAWHLFNAGFDAELDKEDRVTRDAVNDNYRYRRPEEELIARYFKPADHGQGQFYSATEISIILNRLSPSLRINPNNIGKSMSAIYHLESYQEKINGKNTRGYWLYHSFTHADGEKPRTLGNTTFTDNSFPESENW